MIATSPPGARLRFAAYGVLIGFVLLGAFAAVVAPRTPYEELKAQADAGWVFPTLENQRDLVRTDAATRFEVDPDRMISSCGGWASEMNSFQGLGPFSSAMLMLLVLGAYGWFESHRWARTR